MAQLKPAVIAWSIVVVAGCAGAAALTAIAGEEPINPPAVWSEGKIRADFKVQLSALGLTKIPAADAKLVAGLQVNASAIKALKAFTGGPERGPKFESSTGAKFRLEAAFASQIRTFAAIPGIPRVSHVFTETASADNEFPRRVRVDVLVAHRAVRDALVHFLSLHKGRGTGFKKTAFDAGPIGEASSWVVTPDNTDVETPSRVLTILFIRKNIIVRVAASMHTVAESSLDLNSVLEGVARELDASVQASSLFTRIEDAGLSPQIKAFALEGELPTTVPGDDYPLFHQVEDPSGDDDDVEIRIDVVGQSESLGPAHIDRDLQTGKWIWLTGRRRGPQELRLRAINSRCLMSTKVIQLTVGSESASAAKDK